MYCPQCKAEYREGFDTCAECQVPLVDGQITEVEETQEDDSPLKILLETSHPTSLDSIVVKLEERGIPYILQSGTALSMLEGLMIETLPEDWRAVLLVPTEYLEKARQIAAESTQQSPESVAEED